MYKPAFQTRTFFFLAMALSGCHLVVDFDDSRIGADAATDSGNVNQDMGQVVVDGGRDGETDADVTDGDTLDGDIDADIDMDVADMDVADMAIDMVVPVDMTIDMVVPVDMTVDACTPTTFYRDSDEDGAGNPFVTMSACVRPEGYVANDDDCNDGDDVVYGGATEVCDGKDNDCDLDIDEGVKTTFYPDADDDTYGNSAASMEACTAPVSYITRGGDCDDDNGDIKPGATELCDGINNDCNVGTADGTGEETFGDACDESDDETCGGTIICGGEGLECSVHPSPGFCYDDDDGDTFGDATTGYASCACATSGGVTNALDCDDTSDTSYEGAPDLCDGVQNDCSASMSIEDGADEGVGDACVGTECNGVKACDGTAIYCDAPSEMIWYEDFDRDGYGSDGEFAYTLACSDPSDSFFNYTDDNNTDCNDGSNTIYPSAPLVCPPTNPASDDRDCNGALDSSQCP